MICINCPASDIDEEDITCEIYENQREIVGLGTYGCSRRSVEKIKKEMDRLLQEEIKALEEMYYSK